MASEDGTAAAAQQLGSISLGESVESKENDTEPDAKNGTPTKKLCSACGKKSDTVKKCTACKCVWYCDKKCQKRHRKEHRKECVRIKTTLGERGGKLDLGTECDLLVGPLGEVPPREECPICMRPLPIHEHLHRYVECCGNTLCSGCDYQHRMKSGERLTCAFCRTTLPESQEEALERLSDRAELKDPKALQITAMDYARGNFGRPVDQAKCINLLRQSADLGNPLAQMQLAAFYHDGEMGLEQNNEEAFKYRKKAAEGGHMLARHVLGFMEDSNDEYVAAIRHWRLSASGGYRESMKGLIIYFEVGLLRHGDLAEILQNMYLSRAEMRSEERNKYLEYMKSLRKDYGTGADDDEEDYDLDLDI